MVKSVIDKLVPDTSVIIQGLVSEKVTKGELQIGEGYDTKEAAALLGLTPGAVKVRLHRARAALKTLLEPIMRRERL